MTYSDKLKDPRWQKKRLEMLALAGWKCQRCHATTKTLHVHHTCYENSEPWDIDNRYLRVLCEDCHQQEHSRTLWLQREGIQEWPINLPGQEHFFGYIVGLGVLEQDRAGEGHVSTWAEFAYSGEHDKFDIPTDGNLIEQLWGYLYGNMEAGDNGMYGKVWVKLTENGYEVNLP